METKRSRVTNIFSTGRTWEAHGTKMHVFEITFENGDKGDYSAKTVECTKFKEGEEASYTLEENGQYTPKLKPVQEQSQGTQKNTMNLATQKSILWQTSLKAAAQLHAETGGSNTADLATIVLNTTKKFFEEGCKTLSL